MEKINLEQMNWSEVDEAVKNGYETIIIPGGSVEQHGPHLPEKTDTFVAIEVSKRLAKSLGKTLIAPPIRPGLSLHHLTFPGSLTLRPETFTAILNDYIETFVEHGFKNIIMYSGHGGNFITMDKVAKEAREKYPGITIINGINNHDMEVIFPDIERSENLVEGAIGMCHADDFETSMLLKLHPDLVDMSVVEKGNTEPLTDEALDRLYAGGMAALTVNGVLGDPRFADAERGERNINRMVYELERKVRQIMDFPWIV